MPTAFACQLLISREIGLSHWLSLPFLQRGLAVLVTPEPQTVRVVWSEAGRLSGKFRLPRGGHLRAEVQRQEKAGVCGRGGLAFPPASAAQLSQSLSLQGPVSSCVRWGSSRLPCRPRGVCVGTSTKGVHPWRMYQMHLPVFSHSLTRCTEGQAWARGVGFTSHGGPPSSRVPEWGLGPRGSSALLAKAQLLAVCEGNS